MILDVTERGCQRIAELIKLEGNLELALRVSVEGGGCSGFKYKYQLAPIHSITGDDYVIEKNNVKIIIDSLSSQFISGCVVDFVEELGNSYFEIKNPNATGKCGCGNSFSI